MKRTKKNTRARKAIMNKQKSNTMSKYALKVVKRKKLAESLGMHDMPLPVLLTATNDNT